MNVLVDFGFIYVFLPPQHLQVVVLQTKDEWRVNLVSGDPEAAVVKEEMHYFSLLISCLESMTMYEKANQLCLLCGHYDTIH